MSDEDDFGGADLEPAPASASPASNVIPFPNLRPTQKLGEEWAKAVDRWNTKLGRRYRFPSPLSALDDLIRKRALPVMPWPADWNELGKRARLYVGECVGVVGPTGGGKTSFAIQVARACGADGIPVLWNPKELDAPELDLRISANMVGTHTARIRDEWTRDQLAHALSAIDDMWRFVDNLRDVEAQLDAYRVAIKIAKEVYRRPPFLVIDYIGKLGRGARDPRLAIADAAEAIREMTVEEECYTMILAQPSRTNQGTLTGKNEIESATDAVSVAGESSEIEHACSVMIGLNVFKVDDSDTLDAHALVSKARATGREGRQGMRFHKPGGVWSELDYLPATPGEIAVEHKKAKKDKNRIEPPTKAGTKSELNFARSTDANAERATRVRGALARAGMIGLSQKELRKVPGTGAAQRLSQTLQELERAGEIVKLTTGKWRIQPGARSDVNT